MQNFDIKNKVVLITGAERSRDALSDLTAREFAAREIHVFSIARSGDVVRAVFERLETL